MSKAIHSAALLAIIGLAACDPPPTGIAPEEPALSHSTSSSRETAFNKQLASLRAETAPFHNFDAAAEAGYGRITQCWYHREFGAQGYHYGNPDLIDGAISLLDPEILMFEPGPDGQRRLVGIEYIVPIADWEGAEPPSLLGQHFHRNEALGLYALHVWLWQHNPRGLFADWNPRVSCEHADETEDRTL